MDIITNILGNCAKIIDTYLNTIIVYDDSGERLLMKEDFNKYMYFEGDDISIYLNKDMDLHVGNVDFMCRELYVYRDEKLEYSILHPQFNWKFAYI